MATTQTIGIFQEIADFLAGHPSIEQILRFRPSKAIQKRARALLTKQGRRRLSYDEELELDECLQAETFMRLYKANLRSQKASRS